MHIQSVFTADDAGCRRHSVSCGENMLVSQEPNFVYSKQGCAETFGEAGAQSIKGAHGTLLLIGLCSLLICVSACHDAGLKKKHRTEKTVLS